MLGLYIISPHKKAREESNLHNEAGVAVEKQCDVVYTGLSFHKTPPSKTDTP